MRTIFILMISFVFSIAGWAQENIPDVNDFIVVDTEPQATNLDEIRALITYPEKAEEAGIEGTVVLRVLVSPEGEYVKHVVINPVDLSLQDEVEAYISQVHFEPAMQGGKAIYYWTNLSFEFPKTEDTLEDLEEQIAQLDSEVKGQKGRTVVLIASGLMSLGILIAIIINGF